MRLATYLNEEKPKYTDEEAISLLQKECSEYFKQAGDGERIESRCRLYRGSKKTMSWAEVLKKFYPRKDRKPRDLPIEAHEALGNALKQQFGWNPRTEGVFAQGNHANGLSDYGTVYYFFPVNGWSYVWHPTIDDVLMNLEKNEFVSQDFGGYRLGSYELNKLKETDKKVYQQKLKIHIEKMKKYLKVEVKNNYSNKNFKKAAQSGNEIMFNCPKGYYLVNAQWVKHNYWDIFMN